MGAVIVRDGTILCTQRGSASQLAGAWEFPGGKVEAGETPRAALQREIAEELGCEVMVGSEVTTSRHEYDFGAVTLTTFYCELVKGTPALTEHQALRWLDPDDLQTLTWAPADAPAVARIRSDFGFR